MAVSVVQTKVGVGSSTKSLNITFDSTPTVGNKVVVLLSDPTTGNPAFTASDNQSNTYTERQNPIHSSTSRQVFIWDAEIDTASGTFTVTTSYTAGSNSNFVVAIIEISGAATGGPEASDNDEDGSNVFDHVGSSAGISVSDDSVSFTVGSLDATAGNSGTDNGTILFDESQHQQCFAKYEAFASATTETGDWWSSNQRQAVSAVASYAPAAAASPWPAFAGAIKQQRVQRF